MADRTTLLLLHALRRALAEPAGLPLHAARSAPGLFPSTQPGKQAAQRALDDGLIQPDSADARLHTLSDAGLAWLLHQTSPRQVLDDMVRAIEARQAETQALVEAAQRMQASLESLRARADQVLQQLPATAPAEEDGWHEHVLQFLQRRQSLGAAEDCPLPEVYQQAKQASAALSIGSFHDGLRRLRDDGLIYLHPWTGPLYALPEPPLALLVGHEIAYYASPRQPLAA